MGLFDKLNLGDLEKLAKGVGEAIEKQTGVNLQGVGQTGSQQAESAPGQQTAAATSPSPTPASTPATAPAAGGASGAKNAGYFAEIIDTAFPDYQVKTRVAVAEFGGQGRPYDFVLYRAGAPVGAVVLVEHNRDRNAAYLNSKAAAAAAGLPFINFYTHMPNERGFVINRIKRLAKA
ncbi:MAG: hypothetical protein LBS17_07110 [Actinomycetes bacterium]|jgi:hypothetical protein|nr:hypothetical protein [Actinomycetes bacterium]